MTEPRIAPDCRFRISPEEIRSAYGSAEAAFAAGDFLVAMLSSEPGDDIHACALILSGLYEQGLQLLDRHGVKTQLQRLCQVFALWSLNRTAEIAHCLGNLDLADDRARRLSSIIEGERLTVFITTAMLPGPSGAPPSALAPEYRYGQITAKYVGSQMAINAYDYSPADPFDEFILSLPQDERPDFIFALSPQWLVAKNFHKVDVPKVLWNHDTDVFAYRNAANFSLYDVAISSASQDCFELSAVAGIFCAGNVMLHPAASPYPEARAGQEKAVDVVFTGSGLGSIEKSRFLFHLAKLSPRYRIEIIDGVLPEDQYFSLLASAKFLPIVNRYAGTPSPRWREALTNGACLLYPEGTPFGKIASGSFPYRVESITADIRAHIDRFDAKDSRYELNERVSDINAEFAIHRESRETVFERTLKYAAFMALVWNPPRRRPAAPRRIVWLSPQIDSWCYGAENIREKVAKVATGIDSEDLRDEKGFNNAAQLHIHLALTFANSAEAPAHIAAAEHYLTRGLTLFPQSLLLFFNRAQWNFVKPGGSPDAAAAEFAAIIARFDELSFDPRDADVGVAFSDRDIIFAYYDYAELVLKRMMRDRGAFPGSQILPDPRDALLSACHGYIGWARLRARDRTGALNKFREAVALFPNGLPLRRLFVDTLLIDCLEARQMPKETAAELADAFCAVANIFPTTVLTHAHLIVPLLVEAGMQDVARQLLDAWYRLANVVRGGALVPNETMLRLIYRCRTLLPDDLTRRLTAGAQNDDAPLTPLERNLRRIASMNPVVCSLRAMLLRRRLAHLARPVLDPSNVKISSLWQAFLVWFHAPLPTKWDYLRRTAILMSRGDGTTLGRIQSWGTSSIWARRR